MPSYRSAGGLDDQYTTDGDTGFVGMNLRLQPNQLQAGEVSLSQNGRMDGYWQCRKGTELKSGALASDSKPLRIPFYLIDTLGGDDITAASLTSNVVSLTVTGHGLPFLTNAELELGVEANDYAILFTAVEVGSAGNRIFVTVNDTAPRLPNIPFSVSAIVVEETPTATPLGASPYKKGDIRITITTATDGSGNTTTTAADIISSWSSYSASEYVTVANAGTSDGSGVFVGPGIVSQLSGANDGPAWLEVKGLGFATTDPNGRFLVTPTDANTITYDLTGGDETFTIAGSDDKIITTVDDDAVENVWGSSTLSDPAGVMSESIVIASNLDAKRVSLDTYTVTSVPYPTGATLNAEVNMMQAFDRIYLFRPGGNQAWEWIFNGRPIESASQSGTTVTVKLPGHGLTAGDTIVISGLTGGTPANGTFTVLAVNSADEFTYTFATSQTQTFGVTDSVCKAAGFTKVIGGAYSQPQQFSITANDVSVTDSLLTADVTSNTTVKAGDFVKVHFTEIEELKQTQGNFYEVVEASDTEIKFYVPAGSFTSSASDKFDFGGRTSVGGGFIHNPASPWAVYFQRRLWTPFYHLPDGTAASPTYTSRGVEDEIVVSDILDGNTYDQVYSQFKITGGTSDYLMAMHPFYNDFLIVLMRNSLHLIRGTQGSLEDTVVTELTREVGCLARKSVVGYGNAMFFLSDNGVYGVEFLDEYNLRGVQEPLSKNIQPLIDRINKGLAEKSVGVFFNNRYYLAIPLDSFSGANDAQGNNAILVFNVLNKGWESIDTYGDNAFYVNNFHISQEDERNNLYAVNEQGGVHLLEATSTPIDSISTSTVGGSETFNIDYVLKTRGYQLGNYERKKFSRAQVQCEANEVNCNALIRFETEDPDTNGFDVGTISSGIGEDLPANETANLRFRLGNPRGLYGVLTFTGSSLGSAVSGRPKLNSVAVDGTVTNRQTISQF